MYPESVDSTVFSGLTGKDRIEGGDRTMTDGSDTAGIVSTSSSVPRQVLSSDKGMVDGELEVSSWVFEHRPSGSIPSFS
jgi:hypothetical protein